MVGAGSQGQAGRGRVLIIGGSMSGLLAGLLLRRRGFAVEVFEKVDTELSGRGAGIVVQPDLLDRLRLLGLDPRDLGVTVTTRQILAADGSLTARLHCPQTLTAWERLFRLLRAAFPAEHYHAAKNLTGLIQDADGVTAQFADGSAVCGDLLIGADGIRSRVRHLCDPAVVPLYAGYVGWRSLVAEDALAPEVHRAVFEFMTFCLPPGEQFLGYPVAGAGDDLRPGHRRYNVIWYRPADERGELKRLLTDESGVTHAISIPPPLLRRAAIAALHADADRLLAPPLRRIVAMMDEPILQPIYDLEATRLAFGRVAIIGDAACVARPHVAAGVAKAADDAAALAEAAAADDGIAAGLRAYEAARRPVNARIVRRARHLGAYLQASQTAEEQVRSRRHEIPEAVMAETAVLDFLQAEV